MLRFASLTLRHRAQNALQTALILGASLLGTSADEVVHSLIDAVYAKTPAPQFQARVRIHPNVSELLPTVLESLEPL